MNSVKRIHGILKFTVLFFIAGLFFLIWTTQVNAQTSVQSCIKQAKIVRDECYTKVDKTAQDFNVACLNDGGESFACEVKTQTKLQDLKDICSTRADDSLARCEYIGRTVANTSSQNAGSIGVQYNNIKSEGIIFAGICPDETGGCECKQYGKCELNDILQVVINISVFILGISGSILLLMVFYGGMMWITSGGNPSMVEKGKKTITGAVIGIVIIFGSYSVITFLVKVLTTGEVTNPGENIEDVVPGADAIIKTQNK